MEPHVLQKYLQGKATPQERKAVEAWLATQPENWLDTFLAAHETPAPVPEKEAIVARIMDQVRPPLRRFRMVRMAAAVAVLIALGGAAAWLLQSRTPATQQLSLHIPAGKTGKLTLPDGTTVALNAGSTLQYPSRFGGPVREVVLQGEAFFEVAHNASQPFIIRSGHLRTQVLGTSFNISAYNPAELAVVTVLSGKVAVSDDRSQQSLTLERAQKAVFHASTGTLTTAQLQHPETAAAWQQGRLAFEDTRLDEVAAQLSARYGVTVALQNPQLANCRFNGQFDKESLQLVLQLVARLTKATVQQKNGVYYLSGTGCPNGN